MIIYRCENCGRVCGVSRKGKIMNRIYMIYGSGFGFQLG